MDRIGRFVDRYLPYAMFASLVVVAVSWSCEITTAHWHRWALDNGYAHFDPQTGELILHEKDSPKAPEKR